jgi:iron(III) transport system substrate-binding protein
MKRSATFVFSLTICWLFAAAASHAQTASQSALVEGAKKEGKLVWYTSMAVDTSKPLLDAFLKDYPFIQAELVRLGEEQLMTRILSEVRGGKWAFDIMSGSAISTLVDRHIIAPYLTPGRDAYPDEFKDPQGIGPAFSSITSSLHTIPAKLQRKMLPRIMPTCLILNGKGKS